jgi:hypothetical protein
VDFIWRSSGTLGVMAVVLTVACISIAVARPHSFINPDLGAEWQCSRTLFVVTCSHSTTMIGRTSHRDVRPAVTTAGQGGHAL